ncbi:helix-turn-helix domain-containing protein [Sphingobacterium sp.]|uniref:helix-turn-helix domain-containing protein n=1 Tax=Sphingobacterium sp. TaxID=341027 RepID=UPI0025F4C01F|nr:AraC family transcriptional regulator [Sphingobacterium sp.]
MNLSKNALEYTSIAPSPSLIGMVESIWMLKNHSNKREESIIIPDGKIDLFLLMEENNSFQIFISGVCDKPILKPPYPKSTMFAISFYPLAAEYIFKQSFEKLRNQRLVLPNDYLGFGRNDLADFDNFYTKACKIFEKQFENEIDVRKKKLFEQIYLSKGETTVEELSNKVIWSSRQMNRYFNCWFGIPLKSYINIIRFSNSLKQLKVGIFYPELNYVDQSHFIRQVKKFSGVKPTLLNKNENDRFIQLSVLADH